MGWVESHQRDLQRTRCGDDNDCAYTDSLLMTIGSFRKYTKDEHNATHTPRGVSNALRLGDIQNIVEVPSTHYASSTHC